MPTEWGNRWRNVRELIPGGQAHTFIVVDINDSGHTERVLKRLKNPSPERRGRFEQEIRAISELHHPNVIQLIDFNLERDRPYFVTEYCSGGSLEQVNIESVNDDLIRAWFLDICEGLSAVHRSGHVHRDIKPGNIFLKTATGPAVLGDFGLVFVDGDERLTMTQEQVGSRFFMAPELRDGRASSVKASADIYALGKLLYWMLSGGKVFDREDHRDGKWNLTLVRHNLYMEHIHQLLDWMITLDPGRRLPIAEVILNTERIFELMKNRYNPLSVQEQPCYYCGQGSYQRLNEQAWFYLGIKKEQVNKDVFRVLCCDVCGHLQYFWAGQAKAGDWISRSKVPTAR